MLYKLTIIVMRVRKYNINVFFEMRFILWNYLPFTRFHALSS